MPAASFRPTCPAHACHGHSVSRRAFVALSSSSLAAWGMGGWWSRGAFADDPPLPETGEPPRLPAKECRPRVKACFVRRAGEYGMRWPGQIYDGEAARKKYTQQMQQSAKELGIELDLREEPVYSLEDGKAWAARAKEAEADGLVAVLLDRQQHAWPTAYAAVDSGLPTVIFSPLGSSFTTNTEALADRPGCFVSCTDDFSQTAFGMKMLKARAQMRVTRCLVLAGNKRLDRVMPDVGIQLRYAPAGDFLAEYRKTPVDDKVQAMADELIAGARRQTKATRDDVINGIKSYVVAQRLMRREQADAITMDCLGALGKTHVSLPCIAWSKMNDDGIPAACEADLGAVAGHIMVQYLFDRPGFQQDPVPETVHDAIIGAHCSCPTKLSGFDAPAEPYDILPHHGDRDATRRTLWKEGQRVTSLDVLPGGPAEPTRMLIAVGTVLENKSAPPAGGCVVSVMVKFDGDQNVLSFPGFHQLFFYGDYGKQLTAFSRLIGAQPVHA